MNFDQLKKFLSQKGEPPYRFSQIKKEIFEKSAVDFDEISSLPKNLREELKSNFTILPFSVLKISASNKKDAFKATLKLKDGYIIETALLNSGTNQWSVCVSSQAGCAMKCAFCATGAMDFKRNLLAEEIWGQVLFWKNYFKKQNLLGRVSNVVYMGMGEPFLNAENVFESVKVLIAKDFFNIGRRKISVSTCSIAPIIERFAREFPQLNLAISLHAANDELRSKLMPSNKTHGLQKLKEALKKYFQIANRKVFIEYILLKDINDNLKHAKELINFLNAIGAKRLLHINLIMFNPVKKSGFRPSSKIKARKFKEFLFKNGFNATIRKSLGQDIQGACGQLSAGV